MKKYSIVVIGAGSGGLVVAIGTAKAGKKVLLIERAYYGGDCTNFGCIPSKSLIASAHVAHAIKSADRFGIESDKNFRADGALRRASQIVERVRSHEEPEALKKLGVTTLNGEAHFLNPHTLEVVDKEGTSHIIKGKRIVIATGSSPIIPSIEGLKDTPFLTNETVFSLKEIPKTFAILGGGPIGCELAQAFSRLGSKVHLIHRHSELLAKEDPKAQELIAGQFKKEGITLLLNTTIGAVSHRDNLFHITLVDLVTSKKMELNSGALLVATGRRPNILPLNLKASHVQHSNKRIPTDRFGRTNQKHIFALGDVRGGPYFTHLAENQARTILTSLILPYPFLKKLSTQHIPRVTYTDPEIASVGLSVKQAQQLYPSSSLACYTVPFSDVDRAITEGREEGFISIVTKKWSSKILGATIAGPRAGEILAHISLAMESGIPLRKLASIIYPYPTYMLAVRKAADMWLTQTLFGLFKKK